MQALIGVAFSIGFVVGPVVGVLFSKWRSGAWFPMSACYALALTVANIVSVFFMWKYPRFEARDKARSYLLGLADPEPDSAEVIAL